MAKQAGQGRVSVGHPVDVASGTLYHDFEDRVIPGQMDLVFARRYSTGLLDQEPGMFGRGWSSPFEMYLIHDIEGYRMRSEDGETEIEFDDPDDVVANGGIIFNPGACHDLRRLGNSWIVTRWNPDMEWSVRFVFPVVPGDGKSRLATRCFVDGHGLDVIRDASERVVELRQKRERRGFRLVYNSAGRVVEVYAPRTADGNTTPPPAMRYSYNEAGLLQSFTDALGNQSRYEYDSEGRMVREHALGGMLYTFRFDDQGRCIYTSGSDNYGRNSLEFDDARRTTKVTNSHGDVTLYKWNERGQVEEEISPLGRITQRVYSDHGQITATVFPDGQTLSFEYDARGDRVQQVTPGGTITHYTYDEHHQLVRVVDPTGAEWLRTFDRMGRLAAVSNCLEAAMQYTYAANGDLTSITDPLGGRRQFEWDNQGNLTAIKNADGHTTHYRYDAEGHQTGTTDPEGGVHGFVRDELGRIREILLPDGGVQKVGWNELNCLTAFIDELGRSSRWRYCKCGLPLEEQKPDGTRLTYSWDNEPGRLNSITNALGEVYTFSYNADDQVISARDFSGMAWQYEYNKNGALTGIVEANGRRTGLELDEENRVVGIIHDDGTATQFNYDGRGLLTGAENDVIQLAFQYDKIGRLIHEQQGDHWIRNDYDACGRRVKRTDSLGRETRFDWTPGGLLRNLQSGGDAVVRFDYSPAGNLIGRFLPDGVGFRQQVDQVGRITQQEVTVAGGFGPGKQPPSRSFEYDRVGNLTRVADSLHGERRYGYDPMDRVISADLAGGLKEQFTYDSVGNIVERQISGKTPVDAPFRAGSERTRFKSGGVPESREATRYGHDDRGRRVKTADSGGETSYHWDNDDCLREVTLPDGSTWRYHYDPFGRRILKEGPNQRVAFLWDGDHLLAEIYKDGQGRTLRTVQWELDDFEPISKSENGRQYLCVNDPNGAPSYLLDQAGGIVWQRQTTAFGQTISESGEVDCPLVCISQYHDAETGLHYNRHRYYDPSGGRFLSPDPIGLAGGMNHYAALPNILGWVDPYGLTLKCNEKMKRMPKELNEAANKFQRKASKSGETAACVIYDEKTGRTYTGLSGGKEPKKTHDSMPTLDQKDWYHKREPFNCAEYKALNAALNDGAKRENLHVVTFDAGKGVPKKRCPNCQRTVEGVKKIWSD